MSGLRRLLLAAVAIALVALSVQRCGTGTPTTPTPLPPLAEAPPSQATPEPTPPPTPTPTPPPGGTTAVLVGAGDLGWCGSNGNPGGTGALVAGIPGTVFLAGDVAYPAGAPQDFANCFMPFWGHVMGRARSVPGNHDYQTPGARGYFDAMGEAAGPGRRGYYSFSSGEWLVLMLDSNQRLSPGSEQFEFARNELRVRTNTCALAVFHHPLFTSAENGGNAYMRDLWQLLYTSGVELVINGHDHVYERFAKQNPDGRPAPDVGIRQFTVGSGGAALYRFTTVAANSEVRLAAFGVLKLTLEPAGYRWEFIDAGSRAVSDSGATACH